MHCTFENGNSTSAPFATTMTMDTESRQPQQQSLLQALSLSGGGPHQPDQPGSAGIPGLQPRAKMNRDRRAFRLATLEKALAILDDVDDDVSVSVSLPSVSSASNKGEDNVQAHQQRQ
jgi:hypothetical protein